MNKTVMRVIALFYLSIIVTTASQAQPDGQAIANNGNKNGATPCVVCHGSKGLGNATTYPYLAGLPTAYIKNQLQAFRHGERKNPIMQPIAKKLSDQEIEVVAGYFSSLDNPKLDKTLAVETKQEKTGHSLVEQGKWQEGMPACFRCHGENGRGVPPHFPPIRGQAYDYLRNQLLAWQKGTRRNDPVGLMQSVTSKLNGQEINALARYLSAQ